MKKHLVRLGFTLLRLAITLALLGLLALHTDLARMREALMTARPGAVIAAALSLAFVNVFVAWRWRIILGTMDKAPSYVALFRLMFVGLFFNQLLPTGIGGDVVRAWSCHKLGPRLGVAVRSVLLDRVLGCATLLALSTACLPVLNGAVTPLQLQGLMALLAAGFLGLVAFFCIDRLPAHWLRFHFAAQLAQMAKEAASVWKNLPARR